MMRILRSLVLAVVVGVPLVKALATNDSSTNILDTGSFSPPKNFKNTNLVRNINLEKTYARETINVVVENIASAAQTEYFLPFDGFTISRIGAFEVRDKNNAEALAFKAEPYAVDPTSETQYYRIEFPQPLASKAQLTLHITYSVLSILQPLPAKIQQNDRQFLQYTFSAYMPSAYETAKQKTKLKLPTANIPDYTKLPGTNSENKEEPQKQGTTLNYGNFADIPAGAVEPVSVRYEFTHPVNLVTLLERDVEVSQWGGNLATEERYWLENRGATLSVPFSRTGYATQAYYGGANSALKELRIPLKGGASSAYFVDDIGNVSTSRFRQTPREAHLQIMPRYPVFGGWNYKFKVGWDKNLKTCLRKLKLGDGYVLRVPFLEGPKQAEGISYERVNLRIILPEGATNIKYDTSIPLVASNTSLHRTFMDTQGRSSLSLSAINLVDDMRDREVIVTYDYPVFAAFKKPVTIVAGAFGIFAAAWVLGSLDLSIGGKA